MRVKRARQDNSAHNEIEISIRAWHSCVRTASSSAFVVIPEISHSDISGIVKKTKARGKRFPRASVFWSPSLTY